MLASARTLTAAPLRLPARPRRAMRSLFGGKPTAAALKTGDSLLDFPDYFRPLPVREKLSPSSLIFSC